MQFSIVALPLVVVWTDVTAIVGGMVGAQLQLGISYRDFLHGIVRLVPHSYPRLYPKGLGLHDLRKPIC